MASLADRVEGRLKRRLGKLDELVAAGRAWKDARDEFESLSQPGTHVGGEAMKAAYGRLNRAEERLGAAIEELDR